MLTELDDFDWAEAFKYAKNPEPCPPGSAVNLDGFTRDDVVKIIAIANGENDEKAWIAAFQLKDSRFAALRARCDYTGWG